MDSTARDFNRRFDRVKPPVSPHLLSVLFPLILLCILALSSARVLYQAQAAILSAAARSVAQRAGNIDLSALDESLEVFTPEVRKWNDEIMIWSEMHQLPPALVAIVMQIESCGSPDVKSSAGALGLFQVMPFHFAPGEFALDPEVNAARGLNYLSRSYELSGHAIDRTLAGYNGGLSRITVHEDTWPAETQRYVRWGSGIWHDIQAGHIPSSSLAAWLAAGGTTLCDRARSGE